ncbi:MAG: ABC transporter permease [Candidatus Aminicenantes bacterium]|nr:MAG: ABC transporter permease [Candidatus Aminicenantes bacterium]RPJ03429.1 MAG: ABC transporter permease [Candidatus Aminicenantes bacterium]
MAIPIVYNVRSVFQRWSSAIVTVLGVAGTVGVFVAMLALAQGFRATLVASGSPGNAIVLRAGADSEMVSAVTLEDLRTIEDAAGVARDGGGPLASGEVVVIAAFPLAKTGTDANVQVRGVSPRALAVRPNVRLKAGRFFQPGLAELVVGSNAIASYRGFVLGGSIRFGGGTWKVVGVFDAGGSAFDSEIWCDANVLSEIYKRPTNVFQSATVRLESPAALARFKDALTSDPRLSVRVSRETDYYRAQSRTLTDLIRLLGFLVALVMGVGAVFAALNTMYSAVAERSREIATMRALGFGGGTVVLSFVFESLFIALIGGLVGCLAVLPMNGFTTGTINWQTFSHLAFAFRITPALLAQGLAFALLMGLVGGVPPAVRAVRRPVAAALRGL